jgi:hypothetical protein
VFPTVVVEMCPAAVMWFSWRSERKDNYECCRPRPLLSTFFPSYKSQPVVLFEECITYAIKILALWLIYGVASISDGRMTFVGDPCDTTRRVATGTAGLGTKNDCTGGDQQQLTPSSPMDK